MEKKKKKWKQLRKTDANELQEKFDALVEENGKLKSDLSTIMAEKVKAEEDLVTMSKQTPAAALLIYLLRLK
jgi:CRP-like cAMP-binding protein